MACALVAGCAAPQHDELRVTQHARVAPAAAPAFADCVADGWRAGQNALSNVRIEQTRRADGVRVESRGLGFVFAAADVRDDGTAELRIGTSAGSPQRAWSACVARYAAGAS